MIQVFVRRGARAPEALRITIKNPEGATQPLDLSSVTAAVLEVVDVRNQKRTWSATMSGQTTTSLVATHVFASDGNDVPKAGRLEIVALLTTAAGQRRAGPLELDVV